MEMMSAIQRDPVKYVTDYFLRWKLNNVELFLICLYNYCFVKNDENTWLISDICLNYEYHNFIHFIWPDSALCTFHDWQKVGTPTKYLSDEDYKTVMLSRASKKYMKICCLLFNFFGVCISVCACVCDGAVLFSWSVYVQYDNQFITLV